MALLFLLCLLCLSVSAEGRTWHNFNGFQYSIEMTPVNSYAEADGNCSMLQANVANVKTDAIFNFLKTEINLTDFPNSLFIGARILKDNGTFKWNDGSEVAVPGSMWKTGQSKTDDVYERCMTMGYHDKSFRIKSYKFYEVRCTRHSARYICEKIAATATLSSTTVSTASKPTTSTENIALPLTVLPSTKSTNRTVSKSGPVNHATQGRTWHNFNGFQYSIETTAVTSYAEAEMGCSALQANVANVKTTAIFEFLKTYIPLTDKPFSLYIGAKRIGNTTKFQWNDGSDVSFPSSIWGQRQPNNLHGNDNCITMGLHKYPVESTSYSWFDVPCTNHNARYICEKTVADFVAPPKLNTAIIAPTIGGCVILVIICIVIVFVTSWRKRRRNKAVNEAVVIEYNARGDEFEPEEMYNMPQIEENSFANHSIQPSSRHQDNDVNHYHAILEPRHENVIVEEVAQPEAGSSDVYAQVRKSKQSTKVHDNGQQSHVRKYDHNQLDEVSYDSLQLSQHVEVHDQFARGGNPTNIYDNRHGANNESDSPYDELRRHK